MAVTPALAALYDWLSEPPAVLGALTVNAAGLLTAAEQVGEGLCGPRRHGHLSL